jgi:HEAT repeat protein
MRARAVQALANAGPAVPEVIPALSQALTDPDPQIRRQAAQALLRFGPEARAVIPALETLAESDSDETIRNLARQAVQKIQNK